MLVKLFLLVFFVIGSACGQVEVQDGVSIVATRTVDLTSQIVKAKVEYEIKNQGKSDINYFLHAISNKEQSHLSWITASEGKKDSAKLRLSKVTVKGAPTGLTFYKIELLNMLAAGGSTNVAVEYSLTGSLVPLPAEITQAESQYIVYNGFSNTLSAYPVEKDSSSFKVGGTKPLSFTEASPSKYSGDKISYGPYESQKPFTRNEVRIHYENNSPFVVAVTIDRWIEVSHWGNIAVEESIEVVHKGAKLKGSFSRLDYQMDRRGLKQPVVKSFKTVLPSASRDIYYRDQIGNISTSTVFPQKDRLEVEIRPRFPLYGGWRTNYVLGYNIPTAGFLSSSGSDYALKIKLFDRLFDNAVVEKLRVKIVLPEGSKGIKLITPFNVKRLPDEVHKTYLDTIGRPVIVLGKDNLVNNHIQPFTVYYEYDKINFLTKPLVAVAAFFVIFFVAIILFRLDFSIGANKEAVAAHAKKD